MVMVLGGSGTANGITSFSDNATFLGALGITGALKRLAHLQLLAL
jgi:hypothetical protein